MEDLKFEDIKNYKPQLFEVTLLGKRAYIRRMSFDEQEIVVKRFQGKKLDKEATLDDMKFLVACVLCDKDSNLICKNPQQASKFFGRIDGEDLIDLFNQITDLDIMVKEAEKNSKATPRKK